MPSLHYVAPEREHHATGVGTPAFEEFEDESGDLNAFATDVPAQIPSAPPPPAPPVTAPEFTLRLSDEAIMRHVERGNPLRRLIDALGIIDDGAKETPHCSTATTPPPAVLARAFVAATHPVGGEDA